MSQYNRTNKELAPVDLGALSVQQLSQIKKQLDEETQSLTNSYAQLRAAQQKFRDCIASIVAGVANSVADKPLLVPLTSSLYVPGTLASTETVLVDVGTGFYVEKTTEQAKKFYETKVEELGKNVKDLESIVQGKNQNLRLIEEGMLEQKKLHSELSADTKCSHASKGPRE
jgi:prefoldin alpha subunit